MTLQRKGKCLTKGARPLIPSLELTKSGAAVTTDEAACSQPSKAGEHIPNASVVYGTLLTSRNSYNCKKMASISLAFAKCLSEYFIWEPKSHLEP